MRPFSTHAVRALRFVGTSALIATVATALVAGPTLAGKPGGGTRGCVRNAPSVLVDNTWAWGQTGSFGLPGQQLTYSIDVINRDTGCSATSFVATIGTPSGFAVSFPTNIISLKSASSGYLWAQVTSPGDSAVGDYPLTVSISRAGSGTAAASTNSWYKVYSADTVAPTLFWPSPSDGATITGRSYNVAVSSSDDHAVRSIDLVIDGVAKATKTCDDISSTCDLNYSWSPSGAGQHTATWTSHDWLGNPSTLTVTFTVG